MLCSPEAESGRTGRGRPADRAAPGRPEVAPHPSSLLLLAAAAVLACGCARPSSPPGAEEETRPPAVRSVHPPRDSVVAELGGRARVQFDEPIQGRGDLGRRMVASPAYRYDVSVGHSEISVRPEEGWRPGAVYVIEFPAGISDLLDNSREEGVRLVFSTGPAIRPTRVTARLFDRVTGEEQPRGRVLFMAARRDSPAGAADTVPYTAVADSAGRYVLRHLPPRSYWAYGFVDGNRNRRLDRRLEPYDSARVVLDSHTAEASMGLFLLEPDSTPPRPRLVEVRDSMTVRVGFDDHLRPGRRPGAALVRRAGGGDSVPVRGARVLTAEDTVQPGEPPEPDSAGADTTELDGPASDTATADRGPEGQAAAAAVDTATGDVPAGRDTAAVDTAAGDASLPPPGADSAVADTAAAERPPRPTKYVEVRLERALTPDTFRIRLRDVRNVWGLAGEVDTIFTYAPRPDSAAADTSAGAPPADTLAEDGAGPPPDRRAAPPDTALPFR